MTSFEATPNHSTAEEAARIALVAMHAALADELPRDWDGPYRISGDARSQPTSQVIIDYLMRIAPKPVRLTGRWRADHMEIDLEVGIDRVDDKLEKLLRHFEPFGVGNPTPVPRLKREPRCA